MVNFINSWVQGIILSIIIATIIEIILPEGNNKKYVRLISKNEITDNTHYKSSLIHGLHVLINSKGQDNVGK